MKWVHSKHLYRKLSLIVVAEAIAYILIKFIDSQVDQHVYVSIPYLFFGGLLAYVVVIKYDIHRKKRELKLRKEIDTITRIAQKQYRDFLEEESEEETEREVRKYLKELEESRRELENNEEEYYVRDDNKRDDGL